MNVLLYRRCRPDDSADFVPACTADACGQGKRPCPAPEACQLPEREALRIWLWPVAVILAIAAVAADVLT